MKGDIAVYSRPPDFVLEVWLAPAGYEAHIRVGKSTRMLNQARDWPESVDKEIAYPRLLGRTMKVLSELWKGKDESSRENESNS